MIKKPLNFVIMGMLMIVFGAQSYAQNISAQKYFPQPDKIRFNGSCLFINGQETFVYSAAFHYFRTPKELWRDRFAKIKAAGFNTVETYVPWNLSEMNMPKDLDDLSQFNFKDLMEWLHMAQDEFGFYTVLRPGAFICAEFAGGGYPRWLAKFRPDDVDGFWLRSADKRYLDWHDHWYKGFCKAIRSEQITNKRPGKKGVILVQIENEYNAHKTTNKSYALQRMYESVQRGGINVPVFTCLTSETRGSKDPALAQVFDCDNYYVGLRDAVTCARRMQTLKQQQPDAPGFVTELQGGWFSTVGSTLSEDHYSNDRHFYAIAMMSIAGGSTGIFPYVFVGGTHFEGWGARGQTTTYDYNAAIRENGALSSKYYAAKNIGDFIRQYGGLLIHSKGGVCTFTNAPEEIVGGFRISSNGTRFIFIHNNSPKETRSGTAQVRPGQDNTAKPMYNIDQDEKKVLIANQPNADPELKTAPFKIAYELAPLETKVLIIPPGLTPEKGNWWFFQKTDPTSKPVTSVRIQEVKKTDETADGQWRPLPVGKSLPELKINDSRYVRYRTNFELTDKEADRYTRLLFNTFSRDIISLEINGKIAPRLYPQEKWAAEVTRQRELSFTFLKENEFHNRFDVTGLLKHGRNDIWIVYENIGHEHGYYPMEELAGIRTAGLSVSDTVIDKKLNWEYDADLAGVNSGFTRPDFVPDKNWTTLSLDTTTKIARKGNGLQPKGKQNALLTWYQANFKLPEKVSKETWRLLINASGNGYIYINGHNIGRHWEAGPQREYYIPECWLKFKKGETNTIVLGLRQTVNGAVIKSMEIRTYDNEGI
ncbi:beta-galactosidase [Mucilaginibacter terrae]|uniref:Beta-galactosidase n=1 Tax=Mucilaginibacter terrae TaxID=1955052 RepID=A0ABU3GNS7_9SPHI|nr:beta-galactosidase [Mucilaginibacter terrae]MDT3401171.1 hypothetical protein [Mucilaginibacter terrae]